MHLSLEEIGIIKKQYKNENPLNICSGVREIEGNYEIKQEDKEILDIITSPERVSRVILQENGLVVEKYGYVKNDNHIIAENMDDIFVFNNTKERLDIAVAGFSEFIGMSEIRKANINIVMGSQEEVLLFMALIDIYREKSMLKLCGQEVELSAIFGEIREHLDKPLDSSMVTLFKNNYKYTEPAISDTKNLLNKFVEKGIITFDKKYKLTENYEILAITCLVPDVILTAEMLELENNNIVSNSMLYLSSGIQSNLLFTFGEDGIEISTVSSYEMTNIIKNILNCPKL